MEESDKNKSLPKVESLYKRKFLEEQLKDAEHIVKAILIRKNYVIPTYLATMSEKYAKKYEIEI